MSKYYKRKYVESSTEKKNLSMSKEWGEQVEGDNWSSLKRQMRKEVIGR